MMTDALSQLGPESPLEVVPLVGVPPLRFGMSLEAVRTMVGEPGEPGSGAHESYFFDSRLMVEHPDGKVRSFEISWGVGSPRVTYRGVSVFDTPAEELVEHITGERPDRDYDEFTDFELDLGLWRPVLPSDYEPDDPEDENRNGRYWMTIAIGHGGLMREIERQIAANRARRS